MRRHGILFVVLFAVLALIGLAGPASAQTDYTPEQIVTISNPNPQPCEVVTITGSGFEPGEEIPISANGQLIGTAIATADGTFTFQYTVPCNATGSITFTVGEVIVSVSVSSATATTAPTQLPTTGSDSTRPLASAGVLLVAGGGVLVLGTRSRRERSR